MERGDSAQPHTVHSDEENGRKMAASGRVAARLRTAGAVICPTVGIVILGYVALRLLALVSGVIIAVGVALLIAALLRPGVTALRHRRVPGWLATLLVLLAALAGLGGLGTFVVNSLVNGVSDLRGKLADAVDSIQHWLEYGPLQLSPSQLNDMLETSLGWI